MYIRLYYSSSIELENSIYSKLVHICRFLKFNKDMNIRLNRVNNNTTLSKPTTLIYFLENSINETELYESIKKFKQNILGYPNFYTIFIINRVQDKTLSNLLITNLRRCKYSNKLHFYSILNIEDEDSLLHIVEDAYKNSMSNYNKYDKK